MAKRAGVRFRLSEGPRVRYSPKERELFKLLRARPRSTSELAERHYGESPPFNARLSVGSLLRKLQEKAEMNGEPFRIRRSARRGPRPIEVWVEGK